MQMLHRSRERLVAERTALINQLRAILLERGIVVPKGIGLGMRGNLVVNA
jgi:transposase